jgi:single-strand DNA-binding protein
MANLNKVMLIGRLTRDPEAIQVRGSNAGAKFGFAVNNRKLNQDTQQWEEVPVFIDGEIWNRGENSKQGDRFLQTVRKGQQIFIDGHLKMDQWDDKNGGGKRTKLVVVVENFQYLDAREGGAGNGSGMGEPTSRAARPAPAPAARSAPPARSYAPANDDYDSGMSAPPGRSGGGNEDDIPF